MSTDYVGALLDKGRERAAAERLAVEFEVADAEALPFEASSFDAALSVFGAMFTPEHGRAARFRSAAEFIQVFPTWYVPVHKAFDALDAARGAQLEADLHTLIAHFARPGATLRLPSEYLEVVIERA